MSENWALWRRRISSQDDGLKYDPDFSSPSSCELILLLHNAQFSDITPSGARKIPTATSTIVIAWMFVPVDHISPSPAGDLIIGSLKSYKSSEEATMPNSQT
jgi:hypothetical protein